VQPGPQWHRVEAVTGAPSGARLARGVNALVTPVNHEGEHEADDEPASRPLGSRSKIRGLLAEVGGVAGLATLPTEAGVRPARTTVAWFSWLSIPFTVRSSALSVTDRAIALFVFGGSAFI